MTETLAERVKRLQAEMTARAASQKQESYYARTAKAGRDIALFTWFMAELGMGLHWAWKHAGYPVFKVWRKTVGWLLRRYKALWDYVVIVPDSYGKPSFSKTRAGMMVIATIFAWYFLVAPALWLAVDTGLYLATAESDETIILFGSQEIDSKNNVHIAEGCYNYPCKDGESLYFRIRNSLFNNLWKITHSGGLFYPDYVAASIPTGYSRCIVTSYGFRSRFIIADIEVFPQIVDVQSCVGITGVKG